MGDGAFPPVMAQPLDPLTSEELSEHAAFLRGLARSLVGDTAGAEDLVQDTWIAALERPPAERGSLRGWLATVARHLAANTRRSESRRAAREAQVARGEAISAEHEALEQLELSRRLAAAVLALREPYRTAIYLRYHEGLGPQAIAERRSMPVKTVKTHLARGLAQLRRDLDEPRGGGRSWERALLALAHPRDPALMLGIPLAVQITGGVLMKKIVVAAAALVMGVLAWQVLRSGAPSPHAGQPSGTPEQVGMLQPVMRPSEPVTPPTEAAPREPLRADVPSEVDTTGNLLVQLVREADGAPIAGWCLDVLCIDDPAPRKAYLHAMTDAEGRARYAALPAGQVRVGAPTGPLIFPQIVAGQTLELRFEVPPGYAVDGLVVDSSGAPVSGAEIWVQGANAESSHALAQSGADGRFRLHGLDEQVSFGARAEGWRPSLDFSARELPVGASGAREVTLELGPPGGAVAGRVLDPEGEPVAGARVLIGSSRSYIHDLPSGQRAYLPRHVLLITDAQGVFLQPGDLEPGLQEAHVSAQGFPVWSGDITVTEGTRNWLEVQLQRAAQVAGRVVDASGVAVASAVVTASREHGVETAFSDPFPAVQARTDAEGLFLLDWIAPGEQELSAQVPRQDRLGRARTRMSLAPGVRREVELVLDLGATIRGRVVDVEGRPLDGWAVHGHALTWVEDRASGVLHGDFLRRSDSTDAAGAFVLGNLEVLGRELRDSMTLRAIAPWDIHTTRAQVQGVHPGATDVELVVEHVATASAWLRGRLLDPGGRVPQDVRVTVWRAGEGFGMGHASLDSVTGIFERELSVPGSYEVRIERGGRTLASSGFHDVRLGETTDVGLIELGEPGRVEVLLRGVPEEQLQHVHLSLTSAAFPDEEHTMEEDGLYRSGPLAPGPWLLHVSGKIWFVPDRVVQIRAGETQSLELTATQGFPVGTLTFELSDPDARWSTLDVEIRDASGALVRRACLRPHDLLPKEPALRNHSLPAGHFTVEARTDTGLHASGTLSIVDWESARIPHRFTLR